MSWGIGGTRKLGVWCLVIVTSSNINEVIRAVLNIFFFTKRFYTQKKAPKSTKKYKKDKKHQKAQKRNQAKVQNANKRTKIKNALKKHLRGKK